MSPLPLVMAVSKDVQRQVGDAGNTALFLSTVVVSAMLLFRLPTEAYFDQGWLSTGFCVLNSQDMWTNSHALSFYVDVCITVVIVGMWAMLRHRLSAVGQAQAWGSIFATFGHGCGHLHYGTDPGGVDLRINPDRPLKSLVNTLVMLFTYATIFGGTMPLASKERIGCTAIISTAFHNILGIRPILTFVYAQAAIYVSSSLHMLCLDKSHKENTTYMMYGLLQLLVVGVGILEATQCESFLKALGGHAVYDGMIGCVVIVNIAVAAVCDGDGLKKTS
eukprot:COSAG01_NODE_1453_length_10258_cov_38.080126_2_plen_277_part_00